MSFVDWMESLKIWNHFFHRSQFSILFSLFSAVGLQSAGHYESQRVVRGLSEAHSMLSIAGFLVHVTLFRWTSNKLFFWPPEYRREPAKRTNVIISRKRIEWTESVSQVSIWARPEFELIKYIFIFSFSTLDFFFFEVMNSFYSNVSFQGRLELDINRK